ncbi:YbaN family protein [Metabacillus sp. KIGAM252]|uniref:YbaN family protein n=1 Tax=Metabacillus flavus TaxID=2823519 RepID=A0ABS5LA14_9BACI|nr:YbaN family protein [Metabacillus flavus]MBS2967383.1 YbaN family protein [Metabacillus flavus]
MKMIKTILFASIGAIALLIGIAGTFLPVLPGGPFYLIAAFCFAKSSKRIDNWFKSTWIYKKYVLAFLQKKGMSRTEKIRINVIADIFILASVLYVDILLVRILLILLALYKHYYFIYKIKTIHLEDAEASKKSKSM